MEKLDLKKQYKHLYLPKANQVEVVDVPPFQFVMVDGMIEPGESPSTSPSFAQAMQALYGLSYGLKFASKKDPTRPIDYKVMALEGLWWVEEGEFDIREPGNWCWTVMIMQPPHITAEIVADALRQLKEKKPNPALEKLRFGTFHEGLCLQIMHIGPYAEEMRTIAKMDAFAAEHGYLMHGKHHEIYIGDPMRAAPEKLKTVLMHPVREK